MFKRKFWVATLERAIKTLCQSFIALCGSGSLGILEVNWVSILSVCIMSALISVATSIATIDNNGDFKVGGALRQASKIRAPYTTGRHLAGQN